MHRRTLRDRGTDRSDQDFDETESVFCGDLKMGETFRLRRGGNRKGVMFRILRDIAPFLSLKRLVAGIGRMSIFEERQEKRGRRCCWEMGVGCTDGCEGAAWGKEGFTIRLFWNGRGGRMKGGVHLLQR